MPNACGVRELKIHILTILMKLYPLVFTTQKGKEVELCFSCYENEKIISKNNDILLKKNLDLKLESLKLLNL